MDVFVELKGVIQILGWKKIDNIGKYISNSGCGIVYGGGTVGLMGRLANAVTSNGARLLVYYPKY